MRRKRTEVGMKVSSVGGGRGRGRGLEERQKEREEGGE